MKTITKLLDPVSTRLMSRMSRKELTELIIEASKQAYITGFIKGQSINIFVNEDELFNEYLKEIEA